LPLSRALLAAAFLFLPQWVAAETPVPPLTARVTDLTHTLTADQRAALEAKLATFEAQKGSQVAILVVPSTQPETIEQYSIRVVDQWKLGRQRVDDGVLLIIAKNDRKLRIEVGRGLEGAIPDAIAKRIVSDVIAPHFRDGDFYGGITAGTDRILRTIEGEPLPPPKPTAQSGQDGDWFQPLVIGFVMVMVAGGFLRAIFGRFLGSGIIGLGAGLLGFALIGTLAALIIGVVAFLLSLVGGALPGRGSGWSAGRGWGSGGGFGSGGGGFSGGGGGFSGGGASGSW
jgi:uncharacterized protein